MRRTLLVMMLPLVLLLALVIVCASPYAPVVEPVVDIEEIWALEDARVGSETPLVTALENHGAPLGYDAQENTFYCTLGMDGGEDWPDVHLTAPGADGVKLCFVDDYTYDWRSDAVAEGYPYQIFAYTDDAFFYSQIVFTGLPIVQLTANQEIIAHQDVPVCVSMSKHGEEPFFSAGRAHKRGQISLIVSPKNGLKVEFTRGGIGGGKVLQNIPLLGAEQEMTLLACSVDPMMIRDKLCWDMYNCFMDPDEPFGDVETHYVELFVNHDYQGVYLLLDKYDYEQEMTLQSAGAPRTDSFFRTVMTPLEELDRPGAADCQGTCYEQHYAPEGEPGMQDIQDYLDMIAMEDAEFSRCVIRQMDMDSVIRYALFIQACALVDNEINNMGIWAHKEKGKTTYRFVPWDLDMSWGIDRREVEHWYSFDLFDRMLRLDCGGVVRERTMEIWQEMREAAFNDENIAALLMQYDQSLNGTGAYYRDCLRWGNHAERLDTDQIYGYALDRFQMMDRRIAEMADAGYKDLQIVPDVYEMRDLGPLSDELRGLNR